MVARDNLLFMLVAAMAVLTAPAGAATPPAGARPAPGAISFVTVGIILDIVGAPYPLEDPQQMVRCLLCICLSTASPACAVCCADLLLPWPGLRPPAGVIRSWPTGACGKQRGVLWGRAASQAGSPTAVSC